jgi:hypothetical protein
VTGAGAEEPPAVLVHRHPDAPAAVLREVCAGAEEEGVPTRVVDVPGRGRDRGGLAAAVALAHAAALDSRLDVGIGISGGGDGGDDGGSDGGSDGGGAVAVHHAKLPADAPVTTTAPGAVLPDWRAAGRTAARVVKGLPLT